MFNRKGNYHLGWFIMDVILCTITGGLWLIAIFAREMNSRRR